MCYPSFNTFPSFLGGSLPAPFRKTKKQKMKSSGFAKSIKLKSSGFAIVGSNVFPETRRSTRSGRGGAAVPKYAEPAVTELAKIFQDAHPSASMRAGADWFPIYNLLVLVLR
jgi:hypothetical protein